MSIYEKTLVLGDIAFRRFTGVKRSTFAVMLDILKKDLASRSEKRGSKIKVCIEDRLLMMLEYLREYRTMFHIGFSYGVSESTAYEIITWAENILSKSPEFRLPGKKVLEGQELEAEVFVVDATEHRIERPKRSRGKKSP